LWLSASGPFFVAEPSNKKVSFKCPEIEKLSDYMVAPSEKFWQNFPYRGLPEAVSTSIDVEKLKILVKENEEKLTQCQLNRAKRAIENLEFGAGSFQKEPALPGCFVKNAESAFEYGDTITDSVALWIKKDFVAGPFDSPPL